jgi:hypothetical protein
MNERVGSDFDDFLAEQGLLEEVSATALERTNAWQLARHDEAEEQVTEERSASVVKG